MTPESEFLHEINPFAEFNVTTGVKGDLCKTKKWKLLKLPFFLF